MREAIGGTWLFNLVIFFILLFAGYMCLSINYTRAFNVKDKIINELERNGGVGKDFLVNGKEDMAISNISDYMGQVGYRTTGKCNDYDYGCDANGSCTNNPSDARNYAYCLSEVKAGETYTLAQEQEFIYVSYYKVKVFYHLDLPIIRSAFQFSIKGDTKLLYKIENKHD